MYKKHIRPKAEILLFIVFLDLSFVLLFGDINNLITHYMMFISFFVLILSYFTEFVTKDYRLQKYIYNIFVLIGFPVFSSYIVFNNNFKSELIVLFFLNLVFFVFYTKYSNYLKLSGIGVFSGFFLSFLIKPFYFCTEHLRQYTLFFFVLISCFFIWKTMYRQFLESLDVRETELEENMTMIAHELSSPLASIKVFGTELRKNYNQDPDIVNIINKIIKYVDVCLFNIRFRKENLRKYKSLKNEDVFNAKKFIQECVKNFQTIYGDKVKIEIIGTTFTLKSNFVFLSTIFTNLLHNAFYFIKKEGKGSITIQFETTEKNNIIIFKDTGCGIKPDILPHIFDKGFSRRRDGTGMGLYMCRDLIEHLGGDIVCESELGEYTKFIIKFPKSPVIERKSTNQSVS